MEIKQDINIIAGKPIEKCSQRITSKHFHKIFSLCKDQPWLVSRQEALLELWGTCINLSEQELICDLLSRFTFLTNEQLQDGVVKIQEKITDVWKLNPKNTVIVGVDDSENVDSSKLVLYYLKSCCSKIDGWQNKDFSTTIGQAEKKLKDNWNIVFVDEFSGSGTKILRKINWLLKTIESRKLIGISINVCCIVTMEKGYQHIQDKVSDMFSAMILKKGISDFYKNSELENAVKDMERLESTLYKGRSGRDKCFFPFGFKQGEALYSLESGNTPNNVFPVFWCTYFVGRKKRNTLFHRIR